MSENTQSLTGNLRGGNGGLETRGATGEQENKAWQKAKGRPSGGRNDAMAQWNHKTSLVRDALVQEKWECYRESRAVGRRGRGPERVWGRGQCQCPASIELLFPMHLLGWDQAFCNRKQLLVGFGVWEKAPEFLQLPFCRGTRPRETNCPTQGKNPDTKPSGKNVAKNKLLFHAYKKVLMHQKKNKKNTHFLLQ